MEGLGSGVIVDAELSAKPPAAIEALPTWLAAFGKRSKVTWQLDRVEGQARLAAWLLLS